MGQFVACAKCGRLLDVPENVQGEKVVCPGCRNWIQIPTFASSGTAMPETPVLMTCPRCRSALKLVRSLAGMRVRCNTCHTALTVAVDPWKLTPAKPAVLPDKPAGDTVDPPSDAPPEPAADGHTDPELATVIAVWPQLPATIRTGILAMVRAVKQVGP